MAYKISIDKEKCIGCGSCVATCPNSFEMKDEKANPKNQEIENLTNEPEAESMCPVQAITISSS